MEGGGVPLLAREVPPPAGRSYDFLVDHAGYRRGELVGSQWPPDAYRYPANHMEVTIFPERFYRYVASQFSEDPAQIEKYGKGVDEAARALTLPMEIRVTEDWTFQESLDDARQRVSKIEVAVRVGCFQGADFEVSFGSHGVLGLRCGTQIQRQKYTSV